MVEKTQKTTDKTNELARNLTDFFMPHVVDVTDHESIQAEADRAYKMCHTQSPTKKDREKEKQAFLEHIAKTLAMRWLITLADSTQNKTIDASSLDEKMLLPGAHTSLSKMMTSCCNEDQAHEILRRVRADLPVGRVLPEDAEEALKIQWDIEIV